MQEYFRLPGRLWAKRPFSVSSKEQQEVLIKIQENLFYPSITKKEFYIKDYFSKATYIDKERGWDKRFGELPVIPLSKTK